MVSTGLGISKAHRILLRLNDQESTDKPLLSYVNKPWYWERMTNSQPSNRPEMDYRAELSTEESGSLGNDAKASIPNISHVANQQSSLLDTFHADDSGNVGLT